MEEDTGKTTHGGETGRISAASHALEDYNRAGVPLVEIVSEPDMRSPEEARAYLLELRATLLALGVSDVRMEEGSLRCDANISLRPLGSDQLGTKVEVKNVNSIRSVYRALQFEQARQAEALSHGETLLQETRHWDEQRGITTPGRSKEYASDYRYFPEPDLTPLEPDPAWIEQLRASLPELPTARRRRFEQTYGLDPAQAGLVGADPTWAAFFEETVALGADPKAVANQMAGDLAAHLNGAKIELSDAKVTPRHIADLVGLLADGVISSAGGKQALGAAFETGEPIATIVESRGLRQVSDAGALESVIDDVIAENPGPAEQFRAGKEGVLGFLVGQVMRQTKGSANPKLAGDLLRARLRS
jgi:aspartyl-tRNA(Asn)/glutamyl-tRNA(Gln) amidotransferase subunit B